MNINKSHKRNSWIPLAIGWLFTIIFAALGYVAAWILATGYIAHALFPISQAFYYGAAIGAIGAILSGVFIVRWFYKALQREDLNVDSLEEPVV